MRLFYSVLVRRSLCLAAGLALLLTGALWAFARLDLLEPRPLATDGLLVLLAPLLIAQGMLLAVQLTKGSSVGLVAYALAYLALDVLARMVLADLPLVFLITGVTIVLGLRACTAVRHGR